MVSFNKVLCAAFAFAYDTSVFKHFKFQVPVIQYVTARCRCRALVLISILVKAIVRILAVHHQISHLETQRS